MPQFNIPPYQKIWLKAVPDACGKPGNHSGQVYGKPPARGSKVLAGEFAELPGGGTDGDREENVFPHPGSKTDMPSPPIFGNAPGEKGMAEVFRQLKPQRLAQTEGNIDAAGEVAIDLKAIEKRQNQHGIGISQGRNGNGQPVGNDQFFKISPEHTLQAKRELPAVEGVGGGELRRKLRIFTDRSLNELGEKAQEKEQFQGIFFGRYGSPVYIRQIADTLKQEKGNTQRQGKTVQKPELEEEQHGKIDRQTE